MSTTESWSFVLEISVITDIRACDSGHTIKSRDIHVEVLLGDTARPEVPPFEESRKWFLEAIKPLHSLTRLPDHILRLFLEVEYLFHVLLGERSTEIGVSLPSVDRTLVIKMGPHH